MFGRGYWPDETYNYVGHNQNMDNDTHYAYTRRYITEWTNIRPNFTPTIHSDNINDPVEMNQDNLQKMRYDPNYLGLNYSSIIAPFIDTNSSYMALAGSQLDLVNNIISDSMEYYYWSLQRPPYNTYNPNYLRSTENLTDTQANIFNTRPPNVLIPPDEDF